MLPITIDPLAISLAVLAGQGDLKDNLFDLNYGVFYGTAFCLAPNLLLTAAHVFRAAQSDGNVAIARLTDRQQIQTVQDSEVFESVDLALLHCPNLSAEILPFDFNPLYFLTDVYTIGFPFGLEPPIFYMRAFKGHVVTRRRLNVFSGRPPGYEISFVPPPGLSGSPLLTNLPDGSPVVTGVILQHHIAEYQDRRMELGLALDINALLALESRIIGGSIAEILFRRQRISQ